MQRDAVNRLARRLELAGVDDLGHVDCDLAREIERMARHDLYAALRVWQCHANESLQQGDHCPEILAVAVVMERNFEGRANHFRGPMRVPGKPGAVVTRPVAKRVYQGKVIAQTPDYFVQKDGDTYVLHKRERLTLDPRSIGDDVRIRYPFDAIDGLGIVNENEPRPSRGRQPYAAPHL